jgi:hypothetical protein
MAKKENNFNSLSKRLIALDIERRAILKQMKSSPEYMISHVTEQLKSFVNNKSWFTRTNAKNELAYFQLKAFTLINKTTSKTKTGSQLIGFELVWDYYDYNSPVKKEAKERVILSVFNDIEAQVLNGRKLAHNFDEKKLLKEQLVLRKKELEEQLKAIKEEIGKI